ncbi:uncharacterized protein VTP21DRAFT_2283 [Calcarisporiella thermophila]|uniref:uncharacterized protein n=1 Tax=Calcarisporiella thermophila TaxID=911321 RepID=UPI0037440491
MTTEAQAPSTLKDKSMEEILNRWSAELDSCVREFHKQAVDVAEWDRILIENGSQITKLYNETLQAEATQTQIDQSLEYIESQQRELSNVLDTYERQVHEMFEAGNATTTDGMQRADEEREKAYHLAESLNKQLDDMSTNLKNMIDEINRAGYSRVENEDDPLDQVVKILNAHLTSLNWIDSNAAVLQQKVQEVSRRQETMTRANGSSRFRK